jgi:hypothetical protein
MFVFLFAGVSPQGLLNVGNYSNDPAAGTYIAVLWFGFYGILLGFFVVNLYFYFFIGPQLQAGQTTYPACTKPCSLAVIVKDHRNK